MNQELKNGKLDGDKNTKPTNNEVKPITISRPVEQDVKPSNSTPINSKPIGREIKTTSPKPSGGGVPSNSNPVKTTPALKGGKG